MTKITTRNVNGLIRIYVDGTLTKTIDARLAGSETRNPEGFSRVPIKIYGPTWRKLVRSGHYMPTETGFLKRVVSIRFNRPKKKVEITFRRKHVYRITWNVAFDRSTDPDVWAPVTTTVKMREPVDQDDRDRLIHQAFELKMASTTKYERGHTGAAELIEFSQLTDSEGEFDMLGMDGVTTILKNLYDFNFSTCQPVTGKCVPDFLLHVSAVEAAKEKQQKGHHLTLIKLKTQFDELGVDIQKDTVPVKTVVEWFQTKHANCCSLYIVDGLMGIKYRFGVNGNKKPRCTFVLMSTNNHCYAIDKEYKGKVIEARKDYVTLTTPKRTRSKHVPMTFGKVDEQVLEQIVQGTYEPDRNLILDGLSYKVDEKKIRPSLDGVFTAIVDRLGMAPFGMYLDGEHRLKSFYHPVTKQYISISEDAPRRREICQRLHREFPVHQFQFHDQTIGEIARSLFTAISGGFDLPCNYAHETQQLLHEYRTAPIMCGVHTGEHTPDYCEYDVQKCYVQAIMSMQDDEIIPRYESHQLIEPFDGIMKENAFYLVDKLDFLGGVWQKPHFTSAPVAQYMIDCGFMTLQNIKLQHVAKDYYSVKPLKQFAKRVMDLFPLDPASGETYCSRIARDLIIHMIGKFGVAHKTDHRACLTSDPNEVTYFVKQYSAPKMERFGDMELTVDDPVRVSQKGDNYIVSLHQREIKLHDRAPIMRYIHAKGNMMVLEMLQNVYQPGISRIETVRCDGISGWNLRRIDDPRYHYRSCQAAKLVPLKPAAYVPKALPTIEPMRDWTKVSDIHLEGSGLGRIDGQQVSRQEAVKALEQIVDGGSLFISGWGGRQKTTMVKLIIEYAKRTNRTYKVMMLTGKGRSVILNDLGQEEAENVMVLDSFFHPHVEHFRNIPDLVIIDECSQPSVHFWRKIAELKRRGAQLILSGDFTQTGMVNINDDNKKMQTNFIDLSNSRFFRELCDYRRMDKQYIRGCCRNDLITRIVMEYVAETGHLPKWLRHYQSDAQLDLNISHYRKTKQLINAKWHKRLSSGKHDRVRLVAIKSESSSKKDENKRPLYNGGVYQLVKPFTVAATGKYGNELTGCPESFQVHPVGLPDQVFDAKAAEFQWGYCDTIHRKQGDKINEPFNILDLSAKSFSRNDLLTALGRTTEWKYVNFDYTDRFFPWLEESDQLQQVGTTEARCGNIYRLVWNKEPKEYIGETIHTLEARDKQRCMCNEKVIQDHGDDYGIKLVCKSLFVEKWELRNVEAYYIRDSVQFSERQNVNIKNAVSERKRAIKIPVPVPSGEVQVAVVPCLLLRQKKQRKAFAINLVINDLPKQWVSKKFNRIEKTVSKFTTIDEAEKVLIAKAAAYLKEQKFDNYTIKRQY